MKFSFNQQTEKRIQKKDFISLSILVTLFIGFVIGSGAIAGQDFDLSSKKNLPTKIEFKKNEDQLKYDQERAIATGNDLDKIMAQKMKELDEARKRGEKLKAPEVPQPQVGPYQKSKDMYLAVKQPKIQLIKDPKTGKSKVVSAEEVQQTFEKDNTLVKVQQTNPGKKKKFADFDDTTDTYQGQ